ncbi:protein phosphatase 1 regulatory subunit 15B [Scleropages formosus]|uniref:Protein phosphatase 1 regulatory subunit 15A/B C-terminal domain-containing protein n=1 Tax=Scleropages formosus TaxID=113540 RepID=A0A8C9QQR4_SCLFO|nr:protein phosphatase 1 regulatory subunit 15B [Scleropages formosus]
MLRGVNSDELCSKETVAPVVPSAFRVASLGQGGQESPWLGLLSAVSRPAVSFLKKCLPERLRTPASLGGLFGGIAEELTQSVDTEGTFLVPHLPFLHSQHEPSGFGGFAVEAPSWLGPDSLHELGVHSIQEASPPGYLASAKHFLTHILSNSGQREVRDGWSVESLPPRVKSPWWSEIWGSDSTSHSWLSHFSWGTAVQHCGEPGRGCQQMTSSAAGTVSMPTKPSVECELRASMLGESAGPSCHNRQAHDDSTRMARPESFPSLEQPLLELHPTSAGVVSIVTTCHSEVAVLTPDQDNGYSSLEEEHSNNRLHVVRPLCLNEGSMEASGVTEEQACCPDGGLNELSLPGLGAGGSDRGTEESEDSDTDSEEGEPPSQEEPKLETEVETQALPFLPTPKCQNKAIAYIMGSPCSEESGTESEGDHDWDSSGGGDDDDDGFDSEGASDFSDSEDLDDEDSEADSETDAEVERLWSSLCQSGDPYNPCNFTATLCTASKPAPAASACVLSAEVEYPPSPCTLNSPACSPRPLTVEDESEEEISSVLDAESLQLWNSFSSLSDPYNPLNFQAPLRTRHSAQGPPSTSSLPQLKEAEERMDSGFSEAVSLSELRCAKLKKVRFVEEVEEFYASSDEDRRGPWEEFARDRCRFLRRVQETEEVISYCLAPTFRLLIFQRLYQSC